MIAIHRLISTFANCPVFGGTFRFLKHMLSSMSSQNEIVELSRFWKDQMNANCCVQLNPAKINAPVPRFSGPRLASMPTKRGRYSKFDCIYKTHLSTNTSFISLFTIFASSTIPSITSVVTGISTYPFGPRWTFCTLSTFPTLGTSVTTSTRIPV